MGGLSAADGPDEERARDVEQAGTASESATVVQAGRDAAVMIVHRGSRVRSRYHYQVKQIAPPYLHDRAVELAELALFATKPGPRRYQWWRAGPWAGKTAFLSWFVLHPPQGVRVVSFFVTSRLPGQSDRVAFVDAVVEQLQALIGEDHLPAPTAAARERHLLGLFDDAAEWCRERGETLLLVVDGLDEDRGWTDDHDAHSVAALLPTRVPDGALVVVAGRPDPPIPGDVPEHHPLRDPTVVRTLSTSSHAQVLRREMERDLIRLLEGTAQERDLVGLVTASGGGLSAADLGELSDTGEWRVQNLLRTVAGRSFTRRPSALAPGISPEIYLLGHEEIQVAAHAALATELTAFRDRIHKWASGYRDRDWPESTPEYLLRGYHTMLLEIGDVDRATALSLDVRRHDRLLATTGGDNDALVQITNVFESHALRDPEDLETVGRLAVHRDHLADRNVYVPTTVPALWVQLGRLQRAIALARSLPAPERKGWALTWVAAALAKIGDHDRAVEVIEQALVLSRLIDDPYMRDEMSASVAGILAIVGRYDSALRMARSTTDLPRRAATTIWVARAIAGDDPDQAVNILDQVLGGIEDSVGVRAQITVMVDAALLFDRIGDRTRALDLLGRARTAAASLPGAYPRSRALSATAKALVELGERRAALTLVDDVLRVSDSIKDEEQRDWVRASAAEVIAETGDIERMVTTIRSIIDPDVQIRAFARAAPSAIRVGGGEPVADALEQALGGAGVPEDGKQRAGALVSAAAALATLHRYDKAHAVVDSIIAAESRSRGWAAVAAALVRVGDDDRASTAVDRALETARSITDVASWSETMVSAIRALAGSDYYDEALDAALSLPHLPTVDEALLAMVVISSLAKSHEQALETARRVSLQPSRSMGLLFAAGERAGSDDGSKAYDIIVEALESARDLTDPARHIEVLTAAVGPLARTGRHDQAVAVLEQAFVTAQRVITPDDTVHELMKLASLTRGGISDEEGIVSDTIFRTPQELERIVEVLKADSGPNATFGIGAKFVSNARRRRRAAGVFSHEMRLHFDHPPWSAAELFRTAKWKLFPESLLKDSPRIVLAVIEETMRLVGGGRTGRRNV